MATHIHTAGCPYQAAFPNNAAILSLTCLSSWMSAAGGPPDLEKIKAVMARHGLVPALLPAAA